MLCGPSPIVLFDSLHTAWSSPKKKEKFHPALHDLIAGSPGILVGLSTFYWSIYVDEQAMLDVW